MRPNTNVTSNTASIQILDNFSFDGQTQGLSIGGYYLTDGLRNKLSLHK